MADFNNTIETSTACIDYFVYRGTYETYIGELLGVVAPDKHDAAETDIADLALEIIAEALWDNLPSDVRDDFELAYSHTYHPRYYNFETDSIVFSFNYSDELKHWLFDYVTENKGDFKKFLADNFTSRSGFTSYTPNNWNDWLDGWNGTEWRCVSALLCFFINNKIDRESYEYDFDDRGRMIIDECYISSEYAEKFENGWIGVCKGEWDNSNGTIYTAWLLDADGNIVDTMSIEDYYDDDFNYSAYAAWEYGMEWDLTKDRIKNHWNAEPCEVPNIPETVAA